MAVSQTNWYAFCTGKAEYMSQVQEFLELGITSEVSCVEGHTLISAGNYRPIDSVATKKRVWWNLFL
jgi:hypothetical protein